MFRDPFRPRSCYFGAQVNCIVLSTTTGNVALSVRVYKTIQFVQMLTHTHTIAVQQLQYKATRLTPASLSLSPPLTQLTHTRSDLPTRSAQGAAGVRRGTHFALIVPDQEDCKGLIL